MKFEIKLGKVISPYFNSQRNKLWKGHYFCYFMNSYFVLVIVHIWENALPNDYGGNEKGKKKNNVGPFLDLLHKDFLLSKMPPVDL